MISCPVPAPRTREGKQVAKFTLGKVSVIPKDKSPPSSCSVTSSLPTSRNETNQQTGHPQNHLGLIRSMRTDLNLTALISEVERDIWLLEQLENNSSTKRALENPLELPFPVTEELLNLPGYKPGRNRENFNGRVQKDNAAGSNNQTSNISIHHSKNLLNGVINEVQNETCLLPPHLQTRHLSPLPTSPPPLSNTHFLSSDKLPTATVLPNINMNNNEINSPIKNNKLHNLKEYISKCAFSSTIDNYQLRVPLQLPPPNLPLKRNAVKTRHHSESAESTASLSTIDESRKNPFKRKNSNPECNNYNHSPNVITDIMHQRLLPKENCVTNILYARRLPSPPVFRRKITQEVPTTLFARDDQFVEKKTNLDTSCFSPNRRYCGNPYEEVEASSGLANTTLLYCPLCPQTFGYSFGLECHLLSVHQDVLRVAQNETHFVQDVLLGHSQWCPCCTAQFLSSGVLVKHLISVHQEYVLKGIDSEFCTDLNKSISPKRHHFQCNFCGQSFQRRHQKLFIQHIECKHLGELEAMLVSKDLLTHLNSRNDDQIAYDSETNMSMEVKLMLSLSKTVTFGFNEKRHMAKIEKNKSSEATNVTSDVPSIKRDRFGSLRSSLRKKKNAVEKSDAVKVIEVIPPVDQSLVNHKQFVQHDKIVNFHNVENDKHCELPAPELKSNMQKPLFPNDHTLNPSKERGRNKAGKRSLRFSIPEVVRHNYYNSTNNEQHPSHSNAWKQQVSTAITKRERNSTDDISAHTLIRPIVKQQKRRLRSLERPSNIQEFNTDSTILLHTPLPPSRQPHYHKPNRLEESTTLVAKGTPYVNKSRGPQFALGCQRKSTLEHIQNLPYIPSTYRHIPQPEPPPPLLKTMQKDSSSQYSPKHQKPIASKKNSLVFEEEFESLSSTSATSSAASTTSSILKKEYSGRTLNSNFSYGDSLGRWSTMRECDSISIPLQIKEEIHQENDEGTRLFKCNLCEVSFADNVILLGHLKNRHRSSMTKALRPQFSCGVCPAKFFKNSFLIKHCETHERTR